MVTNQFNFKQIIQILQPIIAMESTHGINPEPLLLPTPSLFYCCPYLGFRTQIGEDKQVSCPPALTRRG